MGKKNSRKQIVTGKATIENSSFSCSEQIVRNREVERYECHEISVQEITSSHHHKVGYQYNIFGHTTFIENYIELGTSNDCVMLHGTMPVLERCNQSILIEFPYVRATTIEGLVVSNRRMRYALSTQPRMHSNESSLDDTKRNNSQNERSTLGSSRVTGENMSGRNQTNAVSTQNAQEEDKDTQSINIIKSLNLEQFKELEFFNPSDESDWYKSMTDGASECGEDSDDDERFLIDMAEDADKRIRRQTKVRRK